MYIELFELVSREGIYRSRYSADARKWYPYLWNQTLKKSSQSICASKTVVAIIWLKVVRWRCHSERSRRCELFTCSWLCFSRRGSTLSGGSVPKKSPNWIGWTNIPLSVWVAPINFRWKRINFAICQLRIVGNQCSCRQLYLKAEGLGPCCNGFRYFSRYSEFHFCWEICQQIFFKQKSTSDELFDLIFEQSIDLVMQVFELAHKFQVRVLKKGTSGYLAKRCMIENSIVNF